MKSRCYNELVSGMSLHDALTEVVQKIWGVDHNYRMTDQRIDPEQMLHDAVTELEAYGAYSDGFPKVAATMDWARDILKKLQNRSDIEVIRTLGTGRPHNDRQKEVFGKLREAEQHINDGRAELVTYVGDKLIDCECGK